MLWHLLFPIRSQEDAITSPPGLSGVCSSANMLTGYVAYVCHHFTESYTCVMQSDDRVIKEEGLDNLTDDELRGACRSRGMRTPYGEGAVVFMRKQLQEWLDLSLNR